MRRADSARLQPLLVAVLLAWAGLLGCSSQQEELPVDRAQVARIELSSTAFAHGQPIPQQYTGEGTNISPPLSWSAPPEGTQQLVLICDDPDAPRAEPWVHWVVYGIPPDATGLPENFRGTDADKGPLAGVIEGKNTFGNIGYGGPMPPPGDGTHRYFFTLYAVGGELDLEPGLDKPSLLEAVEGHILGRGELMGTYER